MANSGKVAVLVLGALISFGCAGAAPQANLAPACSGAIGLSAALNSLRVGEQRVRLSVFPQSPAAELPQGPDPSVRVRFFRVIAQSPELTRPGQELRLYAPEIPPTALGKGGPEPTPFGVQRAYAYEASVVFDQPGLWGIELFVRTAWQIAPAMTTLMFRVAPANAD